MRHNLTEMGNATKHETRRFAENREHKIIDHECFKKASYCDRVINREYTKQTQQVAMKITFTTTLFFVLFIGVRTFHVSHPYRNSQKLLPRYSSSQEQEHHDDDTARSSFGTKSYWDDVYSGRGDFPATEYSWYFGWETLGQHVRRYLPPITHTGESTNILIPGIGNDPLLIDLIRAGYRTLTAQDYSVAALERQNDLLWYEPKSMTQDIDLCVGNVKNLPSEWADRFNGVIEKGLLDAVYLSGDGQVEKAAEELHRVIKPGGILISVSGVVPHDLRTRMFTEDRWTWLRNGNDDLKAGCFILQKIDGPLSLTS